MQTGPGFDSSMPEVFAGAYGIRRDTTTGLDYMRFRWYANDLSSFISADRIRGTNRYAYAKGNPVKYVDPMVTCSPKMDPFSGSRSRERTPSTKKKK